MRELKTLFRHFSVSSEPGVYLWRGVGSHASAANHEVAGKLSPAGFDPSNLDSLIPFLDSLRGHWAAVAVGTDTVRLSNDLFNSRPLYWAITAENVWLSDDFFALWEQTQSAVDECARQQVALAGFTFGKRTFALGIHTAPIGANVTIDLRTGKVAVDSTRATFRTEEKIFSESDFLHELQGALDTVMWRAVNELGDHRAVLPLSGGFDSRLLAIWFAKNAPDRVVCFTYGRAGNPESEVSREIAQNLGLEWHGVEFDANQIQAAWREPQTAEFLRYASAGFSLPHIQDWFALKQLRAAGILQPGDIIFPGHTVVMEGNSNDLLAQRVPPAKVVARKIAQKHASLHPHIPVERGQEDLRDFIREFITELDYQPTRRCFQNVVEGFNLATRQAKYINNSSRAYEFFDLRWAAPMYDREVRQTWTAGSFDLTFLRSVYENWIDRLYREFTGTEPQIYEGAGAKLARSPLASLKVAAKAVHLDKVATRLVQARTCFHHPLGFDLFSGDLSRVDLACRYLAGEAATSPWAAEFVTDRWHPDLHIFSSPAEPDSK